MRSKSLWAKAETGANRCKRFESNENHKTNENPFKGFPFDFAPVCRALYRGRPACREIQITTQDARFLMRDLDVEIDAKLQSIRKLKIPESKFLKMSLWAWEFHP